MNRMGWCIGLAGLLVVACSNNKNTTVCQKPGKAVAAALDGERIHLKGSQAIGGAGDFILQNDHAAYIVQGVDRGISYYHYGGTIIDGVAMDGCEQATTDEFEEIGLLLGQLDLSDPLVNSTLRAFRATTIEVINDGRNGEAAHIRATGVDDHYWLIEYTLIAEAVGSGNSKLLSQPYGIEIQVDYILPPDSPVIQMDYRLINQKDERREFMTAAIVIFGNNTENHQFSSTLLDFGGFNFASGIPWIGNRTLSGTGAYAFTISDANVSGATISGVNAVFDLNQALTKPLVLRDTGDEAQTTMLFAVGPADNHSVSQHFSRYNTALPDEYKLELVPLHGIVVDGNSGNPVSGAHVELQVHHNDVWTTVDSYQSRANGTFGDTRINFVNQTYEYRLRATISGRGEAIVSETSGNVRIEMPLAGRLVYTVRDKDGRTLPATIGLYKGDTRTVRVFTTGEGTLPVEPGDYELVISRGMEYTRHVANISIPAAGKLDVEAELERVLDTSGYLSIDTHIHAAPSADSKISIEYRIINAAAEHLEIPVATDHEAIVGLQGGIDATGLHEWVATITGEEVTASMPEHLTMFPVVPDDSLRGGIVEWYKLGLPELWDAIHERSNDGVALLNHPSSIYNLLEWDRLAGAPGIEDYSTLQMVDSKAPWSWDFEGVELMNGPKQIFQSPDAKVGDMHFDNWMSFHNHGNRIAGVGCSDIHGLDGMGMARTYFRSPTDKPAEFKVEYAVEAFKNLNLLVSAGAFARVKQVNGEAVAFGDLVAGSGDDIVTIDLNVQALPEIDVTEIRIFANCDLVRSFPTTASEAVVKFNDEVTATVSGGDAHIVIAGFGDKPMPRGFQDYDPSNTPRFITNPIYIDANGNGTFDAPGGKECSYTMRP